ncbi:hypothetical protein HPB50_009021 [Hyalomma asiaticum]|uniref:Uncharacterized protein n=1 Tax=Hyalomma asiaticum TaxID=266040 RepID=A0ACB7T0E2_HYAAI|nr:hypothetical protein HPB50_009021 [Hyalomma asiaticum]
MNQASCMSPEQYHAAAGPIVRSAYGDKSEGHPISAAAERPADESGSPDDARDKGTPQLERRLRSCEPRHSLFANNATFQPSRPLGTKLFTRAP